VCAVIVRCCPTATVSGVTIKVNGSATVRLWAPLPDGFVADLRMSVAGMGVTRIVMLGDTNVGAMAMGAIGVGAPAFVCSGSCVGASPFVGAPIADNVDVRVLVPVAVGVLVGTNVLVKTGVGDSSGTGVLSATTVLVGTGVQSATTVLVGADVLGGAVVLVGAGVLGGVGTPIDTEVSVGIDVIAGVGVFVEEAISVAVGVLTLTNVSKFRTRPDST